MATKSQLQQWVVKEPYLHPHCLLGEGPYYEPATHSLRFVDIKKKQVLTVDLSEGPSSLKTIQLDVPVTVTADIEGVDPRDRILVGLKYGLAVLDRSNGTYEYVTRFEKAADNERLRSNDGAVDPQGRFWLGSMTDFPWGRVLNEGSVYMFDGKLAARSMKHPVGIPNSVSWSPDGKTMYLTHSNVRTILAFDYSATTGLSNERVFYQHDGPGEPDGHRIDVDGNMWTAVYGESCVLKISPKGELVGKITLPTRNVTCVQFVGTELFITTAGLEDGEGTAGEREHMGGLYRVDVRTTGLEPFLFKLGA